MGPIVMMSGRREVNWPVRCHYSYTNFELTVGLRLSRWDRHGNTA